VNSLPSLIAASKTSPTGLLLPLLLVVAFYFLLIRPQRNRQKKATALRSQLLPGQRIVTIGGMFGTVTDVDEEGFGLQIAPGVEVRFSKAALGRVIEPTGEHESLPDTHDEPDHSTD
jgi:preprotein translocase subunit YajC